MTHYVRPAAYGAVAGVLGGNTPTTACVSAICAAVIYTLVHLI